jgi:hypothetical protein
MNLDELNGDVMLEAPGAATFQVTQALHLAATDFFQRSRAWRVEIDPKVPLIPEVLEYEIEPPFGTLVVEPTWLEVDGGRLRSEQWTAPEDSMIGGVIVRLAARVHGRELGGELAVTLNRTNRVLPPKLGREFKEAIIHGALARLTRIPQLQAYNPDAASGHRMAFEELIDRAATRSEQGFKHNRTRVVRYGGL